MAVLNTPFLDAFPKVKYSIKGGINPDYDTVTNIFFRIGVIRETLKTITSYYVYEVQDGDTPEILAEKIYGDAGAGWMILYANDIHDPFYDWPLETNAFSQYIIGKYGSIAAAKTQVHHYEKVVTRTEKTSGVVTVDRFTITPERYTFEKTDVPFSYWTPFTASTYRTADSGFYLADTEVDELLADLDEDGVFQQVIYGGSLERRRGRTVHTVDGKTIEEEVKGEVIYAYDYELQKNDNKRLIKIIKNEYYQQMIDEFSDLTNYKLGSFRRLAGLT